MKFTNRTVLGIVLAALGFAVPMLDRAPAQPAASAQEPDLAEGKRLFRLDCAGCHKWHGNGGGGYGGAALSLRNTKLDRAQIIETVGCGRPGTGMPYHLRDAYDDKKCYGLTRQDLAGMMPMAANNYLRPSEIAVITDYVLAKVTGKGEPNYAQCIEFFGEGSRVCNIYKAEQTTPNGAAGENR